MSYLNNENIVSLYNVFESTRQICMVMEYAGGGDLLDHILRQHQTKITEGESRKLFVQLLEGLAYTHSQKYRDIKAQVCYLV